MAVNTETTVYIVELRDRFTMGMNKMTDATSKFNNATSGANKGVSVLNKGLVMLGSAATLGGLYRVMQGVVNLAGKFEETRIAFNVMTGDKGMGKSLTDWAKTFSRDTVATFEQTTTSMRKLMAYGISGPDAVPLTRMLTTIGAGVGMDRIPYLTLALGQVHSAGRLMGTELRQFREHGVDLVGELAKGLGVGTPEVEKMVTAGKIKFGQVVEAMMKMTQEGGRFAGMLEAQAKTLPGSISVLKDTMDQFMVSFFEPFTAGLKDFVIWSTQVAQAAGARQGGWTAVMQGFKDALSPFGSQGEGPKATADWMLTTAGYIAEFFIGVGTGIDLIMESVNSLFTIADEAGKLLAARWSGTKAEQDAAWSKFTGAVTGIWGNLGDVITRGEQNAAKMWEAIRAPGVDATTGAGPGKQFPWGGTTTTTPGGADDPSKLRNKTIGTGARDIIINIGNLQNVEAQYISTDNLTSDINRVRDNIARALLTVVNDVSTTVR